ncbi:unnamed protein product (macronuclear) [Paramecium tetraurelia]|uniref:Uncharacterized protein n=1 Tax=Paramecium tetraurelia TaxID=5888 RepID=A0E5C2_PARTE|nr:uncharacterized protein GSPATT00023666001 [Paramecium tetraurelia]CAK90489.1 unnamed protein product [Paramecium tetraurelia]|eukprot:XP_001457886.1 hypothetical protein (macronuclear) [Paramecium tetraurelia strain d4-2]
MEFLQKLISIPKNVIMSLKYSQQKKQQIQVIEPIKFEEDCKIETIQIVEQQRVIKKKLIADKQIQTELEFVRTIKNSEKKQVIKRNNNKQSYQFKKIEKCAQKQAQSPSEASDKTKPSQYSYCQNNLIDSFELDEKQQNLQYDRSCYTAQKKSVEQAHQRFLDIYFNKVRLQLEDKEKLIMKQNRVKSNN